VKKLLVNLGVSLVIAGTLLWFVLGRMLSELDGDEGGVWGALWASFREVHPGLLALYAVSFVVVHVARTYRWVVQVRPLGERDTRKVFRIGLIGYAAIVIFPLRLGELVRPYLLSRESESITFGAAMGTAVTERVIDGLVITALLFVAVFWAPQGASSWVLGAGYISLAIFSSASFGLALFVWKRSWAIWLLHATVGRLRANVADALASMMEAFVVGLRSLGASGALWRFLLLTAVYWTVNAFGIWLLAVSFEIPVPLLAGFGLLAVLVVGIMVPAGVGFLGNFQLALSEGVRLYVPAGEHEVSTFAFSLTMNVLQLIIQIGVAVPLLTAAGLGIRGLMRLQVAARERGDVAAKDAVR